MSSCLSGSGRSYGFDLDIVKPSSSTATSLSSRSFHSSSPSSTLSESSNSPPRTISIKKARAPRKRPNQIYDEAAALLSTIYPNIFSAKSLRTKPLSNKAAGGFDIFQDTPELLPPLPVLSDAAFLIRPPPPPGQPAFRIKLKAASPFDASSPSNELSMDSPCLPVLLLDNDDDIDAESILDEEVGEGIDSIMGNLAASSSGLDCNGEEEPSGRRVRINLYLRSLIGSRTGGRYDFGSRLRHDRSMQQALRRRDEGEWWRTPAVPVPMGKILPQFKQPPLPASSSSAKKSKNKKKKKAEKNKPEEAATTDAAAVSTPEEISKGGLGLKLSHDDVLKAWSGWSMFSDGPDSPESAAVAMARLKDIDLSPDGSGGGAVREASVLRYMEKRRSRLFSKKIRYEVRKANADRRPRMQGRFVSSPSLLQQATEAVSSQ